MVTQILAIAKINGRKDFSLRNFVCAIKGPRKGVTCSKLATKAQKNKV